MQVVVSPTLAATRCIQVSCRYDLSRSRTYIGAHRLLSPSTRLSQPGLGSFVDPEKNGPLGYRSTRCHGKPAPQSPHSTSLLETFWCLHSKVFIHKPYQFAMHTCKRVLIVSIGNSVTSTERPASPPETSADTRVCSWAISAVSVGGGLATCRRKVRISSRCRSRDRAALIRVIITRRVHAAAAEAVGGRCVGRAMQREQINRKQQNMRPVFRELGLLWFWGSKALISTQLKGF